MTRFKAVRGSMSLRILLTAILCAASCARKIPPPAVPPGDPPEWTAAEQSYEQKDYSAAADAYERFLRAHAQTLHAEKAYFRLALIHALPEGPLHDPEKAGQLLRDFLETHPSSPYAVEARLILQLQQRVSEAEADSSAKDERIRQLSEELSKIKEIDLRKRPPSGS